MGFIVTNLEKDWRWLAAERFWSKRGGEDGDTEKNCRSGKLVLRRAKLATKKYDNRKRE
jgi:hypothetical protein